MVTKNTIAKFFSDFADAHYQIKDYDYGDISEYGQSRAYTYPMMYVMSQPSTIDGREISYVYSILFADRVLDGRENELEVESDTFQYCTDLLAALDDQAASDWTLSESANPSPFTNKDKDDVAGHIMTLTIRADYNYDSCAIPSADSGSEISPLCPVATLTVNGDSFTTISSGDVYNLLVKDTDGDSVGSKIGSEWIVPAAGSGASTEEEMIEMSFIYGEGISI